MVKLILLGLLAGALFSSTFILNEFMSTAGGDWFWSASLRYVFMWLMLTLIISMQHGVGRIKELMAIFRAHLGFWCVTGGIGFGLFYTGICYAGDHVAGWVVAATFMFTVVTSLLVLLAFGQRFAKKFIIYALIVFLGVVLVNVSEGMRAAALEAATTPMTEMILYGALPALLAAFCYPIGNQLVWQVSYNSRQHNTANPMTASPQPKTLMQSLIAKIPVIETDLLQNAFNKVWLMSTGSLPFWFGLGIIVRPEFPTTSQIGSTLLVALLAGVGATSIFLFARERAQTSSEVAGVDSTQASEVIFALIGGILLLGNTIPSAMGLFGIGLIMLGLILFAKDG